MKVTNCIECGVEIEYEAVEVCGIELKPTHCNKCVKIYEDRIRDESIEEAKKDRIKRFESICPKGKWNFVPNKYPSSIEKYERCLAHNMGQRGLLIHGVSRVGKSLTAWQVSRRWVESGRAMRVLRDVEFGREIERAYAESSGAHDQLIADLCNVPLLFIDDLGKARMTARVESDLFDVIDKRYEKEKPMLITTQFTGDKLVARFGCKETGIGTLERLRECCEAVNLRGQNTKRTRA